MGKFYFYYGTMGAGKTSMAINKAYEFKERGKKVYVYLPENVRKPRLDSRNGSSVGISDELLSDECLSNIDEGSIVIIDEAQFLSDKAITELKFLSSYKNVMVFCFGLLTDYTKKLFPGSKLLIEVAETIREVPCMCEHCDKKAQYNFRVTSEKDLIVLDKYKYKSLCERCYNSNSL